MSQRLDDLVDRLTVGDASAADALYAELAPYLQLVVRRNLPRRLRSKFDSIDVVQSVWADFIDGLHAGRWRFDSAAQLRAFLLKSTRNRLIDRVRQFRRAIEHERPLNVSATGPQWECREPRPSEQAQAADLWARLLTVCPPEHRELLRLKGAGAPLALIADRTGLHIDSVRRVLRKLAKQMSLDVPRDRAPGEQRERVLAANDHPS
jgi:RNA polymerase sigma factor (sigma-70 family)